MSEKEITEIAKVCHEANKAWCEANGDNSQKHWHEADDWQRNSAIDGVKFRLDNPNADETAQHEAWKTAKLNDGWKFGTKKDELLKTHPCIIDFFELPKFQQQKDKLFCAIVDALK